MGDVFVAAGKYKKMQEGKGVYAARDFQIGEVVLRFSLIELSENEFFQLPNVERQYVHSFWGKMFIFSAPARYINHAAKPNTITDLDKCVQVATRCIQRGEMITINATNEIHFELQTFVSAYESGMRVTDFEWVKGGYRTAVVRYSVAGLKKKTLSMKRIEGNWRVMKESVT